MSASARSTMIAHRPLPRCSSCASPVILAIDQGTTSSRAVVYDAAHVRGARLRAAGDRAALPARRLGRARTGGHLVFGRPHRPRGARERRAATREGRRRHRHHQPARDGRGVGPRHRPTGSPRHRLAGPPHHRLLPRARRRSADADREDRPRPRPVLLGHEAPLDARTTTQAMQANGATRASSRAAPSIRS